MKIRPIKSERDYEKALSRIEQLMDSRAGTRAGDELDILSALVLSYEAMHHPLFPPDPVEAIKFRMDQLGMTRKDLEAVIGGRGRISEILSRKRPLSLEMIRRLHRTRLHHRRAFQTGRLSLSGPRELSSGAGRYHEQDYTWV